MARLIDTHCHLNLAEHFPHPAAEIARAEAAGVDRLMVVGIDEPTNRVAIELAEAHPGVFAIVGWHPNTAASFSPSVLRMVEDWASHPKAVAIGEIGLDYHWDYATRQQQIICLNDQLSLAANLGMPVVFHCREAYSDLLDILEAWADTPEYPEPAPGYLFHCFSGGKDEALRAIDLDAHFGIDGPITYKKNGEFRDIVCSMPRDRIMLETDSPYLSPEPYRGRPNSPANIPIINNAVAACLGITPEQCAETTTANAERFFGL